MAYRIFVLGVFLLLSMVNGQWSMIKAQNVLQSKHNVTGKVLDSEDGTPLQSCSVILAKSDTTGMVTGAVSNTNGAWTLKNVADGRYVVKVTFLGYHTFYHAIELKATNAATYNMGTILMTPSSIELNTAVVTGQLKEVEVKEDTVIPV